MNVSFQISPLVFQKLMMYLNERIGNKCGLLLTTLRSLSLPSPLRERITRRKRLRYAQI